MSTYILMRSNKQSAPLSLEQLLQIGFKPYDLIWIEGKSAMWRYPSEVPELMEYAAAVEEQPYDRFYKRKTDEQKDSKEPVPATVSVKEEAEIPEVAVHQQFIPKKAVSVIMPKQDVTVKKEDIFFTPAPAPVSKKEPVLTSTYQSNDAISESPLEVETKYSESLDEIKERYVKKFQQRKSKTAQKKFIIQSLKKAAVLVAIIGSGVLIGFVIRPKNSAKKTIVSTPLQNVSPANAEVIAKEELTSGSTSQTDIANLPATYKAIENNNGVADDQPASAMLSITESKSSLVEKKKAKPETEDLLINEQPLSSAINTTNSERNKSSRSNNAENETKEGLDKFSIVTTGDIAKSVSVNANNYKLRDFGGFRNLELTVTNDSKLLLDNVLVELQYLNINDQSLKAEHIRFQSIEPDGKLTIKVPDNKRGAKLVYKIIKIEPKESNNKMAGH